MWVHLKDGWRDESSEGPYTETLQTKEGWSVYRLYRRTTDKYALRNETTGVVRWFDTLAEAKRVAKKEG